MIRRFHIWCGSWKPSQLLFLFCITSFQSAIIVFLALHYAKLVNSLTQ